MLVGVAAIVLAALLVWTDQRSDQGNASATPHLARFELSDHTGVVRTQDDFAGRWMLVFFGFASCPDVCPTTLADVAAIVDQLGTDAPKVQPLFISIDPEGTRRKALRSSYPALKPGSSV